MFLGRMGRRQYNNDNNNNSFLKLNVRQSAKQVTCIISLNPHKHSERLEFCSFFR